MRLPDHGKRRMFPTEPLRTALTRRANTSVLICRSGRQSPDDYNSWTSGAMTGHRHEKKGLLTFCLERGINHRYLYKPSLGEYVVDVICCKAGLHPSEVYEDWHSLADALEAS